MQVIDGQQRLTTLFIMLAYLHSWAKEQQNEILEQRVKRMLFMQADPLDYSSVSRLGERVGVMVSTRAFWGISLVGLLVLDPCGV